MNKKSLYHGSKTNFEKFDLNFVNTGNELQKYGYGIYLTSNPKVAENYRVNACQGSDAYEAFWVSNEYDYFSVDNGDENEYSLVTALNELGHEGLKDELEDEDSEYFNNQYFIENIDKYEDMEISEQEGVLYQVDIYSSAQILDGSEIASPSVMMAALKAVIPEKTLDQAEQYVLDCFDGSVNEFNSFFEKVMTMIHEGEVEKEIWSFAPNLDSNKLIDIIDNYYFEADSNSYTNEDLYQRLSSITGSDKEASELLNKMGYSGIYIKEPVSVLSSNRKEKEDCYVVWDMTALRIQDKILDSSSHLEETFDNEEDNDFGFGY